MGRKKEEVSCRCLYFLHEVEMNRYLPVMVAGDGGAPIASRKRRNEAGKVVVSDAVLSILLMLVGERRDGEERHIL